MASLGGDKGYGQFGWEPGITLGAHRASWMIHKGPIPDGLFILHKCDIPTCVNPDHLFLGTNQDNIIDHVKKHPGTIGIRNKQKTHCPAGHEYTPDNTGISWDRRYCRACKTAQTIAWLANRRKSS